MATFEETIKINAPVEKVWAVLADIGSIDKWNPGVEKSYRENEKVGIGASRHCSLKRKNFLKEDVVKWVPEQSLTMRITGTNLPFKSADINFTLVPQANETIVRVSPVYELKFGIIGALLNTLFVYNTYRKGMAALLSGLKKFVENGQNN